MPRKQQTEDLTIFIIAFTATLAAVLVSSAIQDGKRKALVAEEKGKIWREHIELLRTGNKPLFPKLEISYPL